MTTQANTWTRRIRFLDLPEDILFLVCAQLQCEAWLPLWTAGHFEEHFKATFIHLGHKRNPLLELSCTCRSLRRFCAPRIFKYVNLNSAPASAPILPVLAYTRRIFFGRRTLNQHRLSTLLDMAENIRDAYFARDVTCLPEMLRSPGLELLSAGNAAWDLIRSSLPVPTIRAPLRILRMCTNGRVDMLAHQGLDLSLEAQWIEGLCAQLHSRLEVLALPAESVRMSLFTAFQWPRLQELFLYGCCPVLDVPLLHVFDMLPRLRAFTLAVALVHGQAPLVLYPPTSRRSPDISGLRRLTLASSSPDDDIFIHVPPELEELSLRDVPRFYKRCRWSSGTPLDRTYAAHILSCGDVLSIFRTMPRLAALHHLELVVIEDEHELDLFAYIAESCPHLSCLELHCYRRVSEHKDLISAPLAVSLDSLGKALSAFRALRVVRVNIDLPWSEFTISEYCDRGCSDGVTYSLSIAQTIARAVPWLDAVCVLTRNMVSLYQWRMWTVHGHPEDVQLRELEPANRIQGKQTFDI